jgi:hypothetical protein
VAGVVRMPLLEGHYDLVAETPTRTRVEYRMRLELGGRLPGWIERAASEDMPFETLTGLRRQVEKTRDLYGDFVAGFPESAR